MRGMKRSLGYRVFLGSGRSLEAEGRQCDAKSGHWRVLALELRALRRVPERADTPAVRRGYGPTRATGLLRRCHVPADHIREAAVPIAGRDELPALHVFRRDVGPFLLYRQLDGRGV